MYLHGMKNNNMKTAFTIYKQGTTDKPVNIVYPIGTPFDFDKKIAMYKDLGYTVTNIQR
jgi:hypothetical protein